MGSMCCGFFLHYSHTTCPAHTPTHELIMFLCLQQIPLGLKTPEITCPAELRCYNSLRTLHPILHHSSSNGSTTQNNNYLFPLHFKFVFNAHLTICHRLYLKKKHRILTTQNKIYKGSAYCAHNRVQICRR